MQSESANFDELFRPEPCAAEEQMGNQPHISYIADVARRFWSTPSVIVFSVVLAIIIACCFMVPAFSPRPITGIIDEAINHKPSPEYWLGADKFGHDFFTKMWKGGQTSFKVGFLAAVLQTLIGVVIGAISGYAGGKVDQFLMRTVDVFISIPYMVIVLVVRLIMGSSSYTIIFALVITGWLNTARLVRGQILQLKTEDYVLAAQSMGVSPAKILFRHLIPNTLGVVIVSFTLAVPQAMFSEAFLSFIGMGSGDVSWGSLIRTGMEVRFRHPWQLIAPSIVLALTMLCIQLLGDSLRDALDPKLRK